MVNSMGKRKSHEEYLTEIKEINPRIEVLGIYTLNNQKILHRCKVCNYEWNATPINILRGRGCPRCGNLKRIQSRTKTQKQYEEELRNKNNSIELLDSYINTNTPILHKCNVCNYKWKIRPSKILKGQGCPVCSGNIIGESPYFQNSIWASKYKEYFSKYLSEDQMKSYMPYSNKKIEVSCPECGNIKKIGIDTLLTDGFGCVCGDGISYPNKFVRKMLDQLKIKYVPEYKSEWTNKKVYDIYIPSIDCIIENNGEQHYVNTFSSYGGRSLHEEISNDEYKKMLALDNKIKHYIVLDCRHSEKEWIKKSILDSNLKNLLNIQENNIDWELCDEYATKNVVKTVSQLWNSQLTMKEICKKLNICRGTVEAYLKKASHFGWCDYVAGEGYKRGMRSTRGSLHHNSRKVIRLSDLHIYDWVNCAAQENNLSRTTITRKCKKKKDFMYYDEYLNEFGRCK